MDLSSESVDDNPALCFGDVSERPPGPAAACERALWLQVLATAIADLAGGTGNTRRGEAPAGRLREYAREWISSADIEVGSFEWICGQVEIDAAAARERLLRADPSELRRRVAWGGGRRSSVFLEPALIEANDTGANTDYPFTSPLAQIEQGRHDHEIGCPGNGKRKTPGVIQIEKLEATLNVNGQNGRLSSAEKKARSKEMPRSDHLGWLKDQLSQFERQLARAEAESLRLKPVVAHLQGSIEALAGPRQNGKGGVPEQDAKLADKKTPAKKNAAEKLKRQQQYQELSTIAALRQIFNSADQPVLSEDLARSIFEIRDPHELARARSSLSARLSDGAKKGYWQALGGGRYARIEG